ncbi:DUF502 domain-containing protein [Chthonobacter rhizosphaerae]|uniref:DUF502 domain-containing protein n=1 Tax=Chthonobacter rhizosphaerae TaxID=2735553 RepID=UPI0015EEB42A|nr:DUF502 domain-containing protein [Chthonobacter rhizosphaerae]
MGRIQNNIAAGVLTLIPIVVTLWIVQFVVETLIAFGRPLVFALAISVGRYSPGLADFLRTSAFQSVVALLLVLVGLYVLGAMTKAVVGRKLIGVFDSTVARVPFVRSLYGAVRRMLDAFQAPTEGVQKVALIRFPTPEMRTLGFVTRVFQDSVSGAQLAAVYVPTAPNPTSGYVEIVPVDDLIMLDWSTDEALQFVVSAGASAPERVPFSNEPARPEKPAVAAEARRSRTAL